MEDSDTTTKALTSWALFGGCLTAFGLYYWSTTHQKQGASREDAQHAAAARRRQEQDSRGRQVGKATSKTNLGAEAGSGTAAEALNQGTEGVKKRKTKLKQQVPTPVPPAVVVHDDEPEESDMATREWAKQMQQARKGANLTSTKSNDQRVKTVKQGSALNTPVLSSGSSQADDDLSPAVSPSLNAGDVTDMLEPAPSGPSTLRVTAPTQREKERAARQSKEESVESKKQRQNRKKVEERRLQREAEEKERKALEERQRRSAREARGEPARNGIAVSKAPTNNVWSTSGSGSVPVPVTGVAPSAPATIVNGSAPLLDTFDTESQSSSNGVEPSTGPTSTSSAGAGQWEPEMPSEEEQVAMAMKRSSDESGWTTVAQPKKSKKKAVDGDAAATELVVNNKTNMQTSKPAANGKPKGFQALEVEYEQRADADPNDAANWNA